MSRMIIVLFTVLLIACSSDPEPAGDDQAVSSAAPQRAATEVASPALVEELLSRIEADTAVAWLSLEPAPQALMERVWGFMEEMSELQESARDRAIDSSNQPLLSAVLAELNQLTTLEAYAERGLNINGVAAQHLAGIYPLLHWELSDQEAFAATLNRIETESGTPLPKRQIGDQELVWVDLNGFGLAIHHDASFMTVGLIADREDLLRRVANLDRPTSTLQRGDVETFAGARGFRLDSVGYVDLQGLLALLMDGDDALLVEARERGALAPIASDSACRGELGALTTLFPRISFGTTALSERAVAMKMLIETDSDLGGRLSTLAETPVALSTQRAGMLSMGLALNIVAARDFGRSIVGGWVEQPPQCVLFSNIADNAAGWQLALNRPIPPLVTNVHGARVQLDRISMAEGAPSDMAATLALFMRNPQMMIGMAQMFSPELAALDLRPGGEPQPLPPGMLPNLEDLPAWIGLSDIGLGLAVGAGHDSALRTALATGDADSAIYAKGLNLRAYAELLEADLAELTGQGQVVQGMSLNLVEAGEAFSILAGLYDYMDMSLHLTPAGIEVRLGLEMAD